MLLLLNKVATSYIFTICSYNSVALTLVCTIGEHVHTDQQFVYCYATYIHSVCMY